MADSSIFTTDIGAVTAYADAKEHGYTGTREEFGTLLANAGTNLAEANAAKNAAKASENAAKASEDNARISAGAAAVSEGNAAASAKKAQDVSDSLPADYTAMSGDVDTLKNQMQRAYPDDSTIGENPWSSKHIVDMLCPPLKESGNPVVCYPVAGYPLGVKAKWEPVQEGSGTPSHENIRPIKGRDSVTVERCGENLLNISQLKPIGYNLAGSNILKPNTTYTFKPVSCGGIAFAFFLADGIDPSHATKQLDLTGKYIKEGKSATFTTPSNVNSYSVMWLAGTKGGIHLVYPNVQFMLVHGTTAPATYTPYIGQTNTLTLPETVYGGEVDAVTGEGKRTWGIINNYAGETIPREWISDRDVYSADKNPTVGAQVAYRLAEPVPFTATGAQPFTALAGVNTVLTDADSATVTGRADPVKRITDLEDAVASQT